MTRFISMLLLLLVCLGTSSVNGQAIDASRFRTLREKARSGGLTAAEQKEFDAAMAARTGSRPTVPPGTRPQPSGTRPNMPLRDAADRKTTYLKRQAESMERMRQQGIVALKAAESRQAPTGPARDFYVNNETGEDGANGLASSKSSKGGPVRTLAKAVSMLQPGDTLHLAVTNAPYRESLKLGDNFGGLPGKPITIDGHGATLTGCDPLRLDGWQPAGSPGLFKSAKMIDELEEFTDESKLGHVFFVFDGIAQHMGRSMKGKKAHFKSPADLQPGEWTFVEGERSFYLKVSGSLADAKVDAPYRRNGVAVCVPKVAATHFVIKNLIVCRVLNDGFNLHGATKDVLLQNIAALECGDDGISPHEICEVEIDGFWSVGNSTGMGNGNLSATKARNVRLEGNLGHQLMTGHSPATELTNAIIVATPGTEPINITNSQDTKLTMDNVRITSHARQRMLLIANSTCEARRLTVWGPTWEIGGKVRVSESVIGGAGVTFLDGGTWEGSKNVFVSPTSPPAGDVGSSIRSLSADMLKSTEPPLPGAGANPAEFHIPPRPVPHFAAGKFTTLEAVRE